MQGVLPALAVMTFVLLPCAVVAQDGKVGAVVTPYLKVQETLAADSTTGIGDQAAAIAKAAASLGPQGAEVVAAAAQLQSAGTLAAAREAFFALTTAMFKYADATKTSLGPGVRRTYCPMEKKSWAQKDGPIANPYAGKRMLRCGEFTDGKG
jgi:Cu(I)/Ag(I) efflux system membrane fusion protein